MLLAAVYWGCWGLRGAATRPSLGRGRDAPLHVLQANRTHPCIEPPPPVLDLDAATSASYSAAPPAPKHLKYLALDGYWGGKDTDGWANLAFLPLLDDGHRRGPGVNETAMEERLAQGYDLLLNAPTHAWCPATSPPYNSTNLHCADNWRRAWFGNSTVGGMWNSTIKKLADEKKIIGVYVGDELLGGDITVSNLSSIFDTIKEDWPEGVTYYNEQWDVFNDPTWRDGEYNNADYGFQWSTSTETYCALLSAAVGKPYGKLPMSLDWISCAYHCTNMYTIPAPYPVIV